MTDSTPYTDDDVKQMEKDSEHQDPGFTIDRILPSMARRLLDAGYRKVTPDTPPERPTDSELWQSFPPRGVESYTRWKEQALRQWEAAQDTPPEPQERYYARHNDVFDRTDQQALVRAHGLDAFAQSVRVARLLNLDAKYEDQGGIGKALAEEKMAHYAVIRELEKVRDHDSDAVRNLNAAESDLREARAEVERLTAEAAKWRDRHDRVQAQSRTRGQTISRQEDELAMAKTFLTPSQIVRINEASKRVGVDAPAEPQDDGPTEPHDEVKVTQLNVREALGDLIPPPASTEPLFTTRITQTFLGSLGNALVLTGMDCAPAEVLQRVGGSGGATTDLVDIYPHGQRPSDTPTSNDPLASLRELGPNWDGYDGNPITPQALAVAASLSYVPCSDGGIQVEAHVGGTDAEFRILPDGKLEQDDTPTSNQPVTAEMASQALATADRVYRAMSFDDADVEYGQHLADALNDQLGARPLPTREQVLMLIDTHLRTGDDTPEGLTDAVLALLRGEGQ